MVARSFIKKNYVTRGVEKNWMPFSHGGKTLYYLSLGTRKSDF